MSADSTGADLLLRSPVQHAVSVANIAHTDAVAKSVEDSDLTMSILEEMRVQFEFKAFGINRHSATGVPTGSPKSAKTSKMKTEREWNEMVHIIHHWNGGDGSLSEKEFRKKWSHKHKNWKSCSVHKRPDGTFKLTKTSPDGVEKKVLHQGLVFDVLLDKAATKEGTKEEKKGWRWQHRLCNGLCHRKQAPERGISRRRR